MPNIGGVRLGWDYLFGPLMTDEGRVYLKQFENSRITVLRNHFGSSLGTENTHFIFLIRLEICALLS